MLLKPLAGLGIDEGIKHEARVRGEIGHDPVEMLERAHHRPEMAADIGIVELRERRLGDHFQRLAGRIRDKMQVQTIHAQVHLLGCPRAVDRSRHKPREQLPDKLGSNFHAS